MRFHRSRAYSKPARLAGLAIVVGLIVIYAWQVAMHSERAGQQYLQPYELLAEMAGAPNFQRLYLVDRSAGQLGLSTRTQIFRSHGRSGANLIVDLGDQGPLIVVAAHLDRVRGSDGAVDNGACVAALLFALRDFVPEYFRLRVLFSDREEARQGGARAFARSDEAEDLAGFLALDVCGLGRDVMVWGQGEGEGTEPPLLLAWQAALALQDVNLFALEGPVRIYSDRSAFARLPLGAMTATFIEGGDWPAVEAFMRDPSGARGSALAVINGPADQLALLDAETLAYTSQVVLNWLKSLDKVLAERGD